MKMATFSAILFANSLYHMVKSYTRFPHEHRLKIRSNNGLERMNRAIRRRTNSVGVFPDGNSALMPVCARLRYVSSTDRGTKKYLNMDHLYTMGWEEAAGI